MKKTLFSLASLLLASYTFSQNVLFSENFNASTTLPEDWVVYDVDGNTPHNASLYTEAWIIRTIEGNNIASSTSWYEPAGQADDWLVSPKIEIPTNGTYILVFDAMTNQGFHDGFKLYISTSGNTVADFNQPPLIDIPVDVIPDDGFTAYGVSLENYSGQEIWFAIRNNSFDRDVLWVDNFVIKETDILIDAQLTDIKLPRYIKQNVDNSIKIVVNNKGASTITSLEVNWNDGTDRTHTFTSLNIGYLGDTTLTLPTPINHSEPKTQDIQITINKVNGADDETPNDNVKTITITSVSQVPEKYIVFEEGTGTWCTWCPRGAVAMQHMQENYDKFIGIAVHQGHSSGQYPDPMELKPYSQASNYSGLPSANVDRSLRDVTVAQSLFIDYYNERKDVISPVTVDVKTSLKDSALTIDLDATFYSNFTNAKYRFGVVLVEDSVTGTTWTWQQANGFAGGGYGPMDGYENLPHPVPAEQMVYNHVGRALIGGYKGQTASIPATISDKESIKYTFNYDVPEKFNKEKLSVVALVIDNANGEIVNARSQKVTIKKEDDKEGDKEITNAIGDLNNINMNVFPNPASDNITLSFEANGDDHLIQITDMSGRVVLEKTYYKLSGMQQINLNTTTLNTGFYLVSVAKDGVSFTKTISIK